MSEDVFIDMLEDEPEQTPTLHQAMSTPEIYHYKEGNGLRFLVPLDDYERLNEARDKCERQFQTKQEELNDARAELAHWKANHDNQVKIKSTLIQRPDLGDRAPRIQKLIEENETMREAIREAAHAMDNLIIAKRGGMQPANALIDATTYAKATLTKLQPYTTL